MLFQFYKISNPASVYVIRALARIWMVKTALKGIIFQDITIDVRTRAYTIFIMHILNRQYRLI